MTKSSGAGANDTVSPAPSDDHQVVGVGSSTGTASAGGSDASQEKSVRWTGGAPPVSLSRVGAASLPPDGGLANEMLVKKETGNDAGIAPGGGASKTSAGLVPPLSWALDGATSALPPLKKETGNDAGIGPGEAMKAAAGPLFPGAGAGAASLLLGLPTRSVGNDAGIATME